jgi:energy-coupling factor transport system substrate-specific component
VSWQLASFVIVLAALAIAFWWYERSNPPAKLLALVATLAAVAALGRDAFAAVPDVKPITAIVLLGGVAFGAGPGFAVGAIAGLLSNILLGQGPWTPWQMLGWGLVGLIGAGLGRLASRRLAPLALALACAVAAEIFNLVVDAYTWTSAGSHTLVAFGLVLSQAAVFDLTHVLASFGFGLAFGPVLLRMLTRARSRLQVSWQAPAERSDQRPRTGSSPTVLPLSTVTVTLLATSLLLSACGAAHASSAPSTGSAPGPAFAAARPDVARQLSYLVSAQAGDGGFGGAPGQSSSELFSAWVAVGLAAAGRDPLSVRRDGHTVLQAIRAEASSLQGAGDIERTILALRACGVSVHSLPGGDPVRRLLRYRERNGSFGGQGNLTAFAILALRAAGYAPHAPLLRRAAAWLTSQQETDGGFGFATKGAGSDIDDTGAALQALAAAGVHGGSAMSRAVAFIVGAQNLDGGLPQMPGGESNAPSTAWAVQGLVAAARNVQAITRRGSRSPVEYLQSLLAPNGSARYSRTGTQTPVWVTAEVVTALAGKPFPVAPVR